MRGLDLVTVYRLGGMARRLHRTDLPRHMMMLWMNEMATTEMSETGDPNSSWFEIADAGLLRRGREGWSGELNTGELELGQVWSDEELSSFAGRLVQDRTAETLRILGVALSPGAIQLSAEKLVQGRRFFIPYRYTEAVEIILDRAILHELTEYLHLSALPTPDDPTDIVGLWAYDGHSLVRSE